MSQETWLLTGWLLLLAGCSASKGGDVFADTGSAEGLDTGDAGDSAADSDFVPWALFSTGYGRCDPQCELSSN